MSGPTADISAAAGIGRAGFVAEHGLHSAEQHLAAEEVISRIDEAGLRTIRMIIVDQHGVPRAKFLSPRAAVAAFRNGVDFSGAIYRLDTGNAERAIFAGNAVAVYRLDQRSAVVSAPPPGR